MHDGVRLGRHAHVRRRLQLGALHREAGRAESAVPALREAERIFTKAEARLDLDRTRQLLQEIDAN